MEREIVRPSKQCMTVACMECEIVIPCKLCMTVTFVRPSKQCMMKSCMECEIVRPSRVGRGGGGGGGIVISLSICLSVTHFVQTISSELLNLLLQNLVHHYENKVSCEKFKLQSLSLRSRS